jgi:hypothetical protein
MLLQAYPKLKKPGRKFEAGAKGIKRSVTRRIEQLGPENVRQLSGYAARCCRFA